MRVDSTALSRSREWQGLLEGATCETTAIGTIIMTYAGQKVHFDFGGKIWIGIISLNLKGREGVTPVWLKTVDDLRRVLADGPEKVARSIWNVDAAGDRILRWGL